MKYAVAKKVATQLGTSIAEASEILDACLEGIMETAAENTDATAQDELRLRGFGTFRFTPQKSRTGQDPHGNQVPIRSYTRITFVASPNWKRKMNE